MLSQIAVTVSCGSGRVCSDSTDIIRSLALVRLSNDHPFMNISSFGKVVPAPISDHPLSIAEVIIYDPLQHRSATARLSIFCPSRQRKGVFLSIFIEYKLRKMTREQRKLVSEEILEKFLYQQPRAIAIKEQF